MAEYSNLRNKTEQINAPTLKKMLHDGHEVALLDVREEGVYSKSHMLI